MKRILFLSLFLSCVPKNQSEVKEESMPPLPGELSELGENDFAPIREVEEDEKLAQKSWKDFIIKERNKMIGFINDIIKDYEVSKDKEKKDIVDRLRIMFNPKTFEEKKEDAPSEIIEGSGEHGKLSSDLKTDDKIYHSLWSRISDFAYLKGFKLASKNMKYFLSNKGGILTYDKKEVENLLKEATFSDKVSADQWRQGMSYVGFTIEKPELLQLFPAPQEPYIPMKVREHIIQQEILLSLKKKYENRTSFQDYLKSLKGDKSLSLDRPKIKHHTRVQSLRDTDLFFALGSFSIIGNSTLLINNIKEDHFTGEFIHYYNIFDNYNWDDGKSIMVMHSWCYKLKNAECYDLQNLTTLKISDRSLGRLHQVGIAQEYKVRGMSELYKIPFKFTYDELENKENIKEFDHIIQKYKEVLSGFSSYSKEK